MGMRKTIIVRDTDLIAMNAYIQEREAEGWEVIEFKTDKVGNVVVMMQRWSTAG